MQSIDLLLHARWLLPMTEPITISENHSIAIHNGLIVDILPTAEATQRYHAAKQLKLDNHVVMPGLINAHTHSPMTLFRGLADDLPLMDWLQQHIWPAEKQFVCEQFVYDGTELAIAEMLRCGTTTFNEQYFFPEVIREVAIATGMRASIGLVIIDAPSAYARDELDYFTKAERYLNHHKPHPLITYFMGPHAPYTNSDDSFRRIADACHRYQLPIHIHSHETAIEIEQSLTKFQKRPLQRYYDLGLLDHSVLHAHMTQVNDEDLRILHATNGHVAHCPESNLKLASGLCPVQRLLDHGINVCIGTDGAASNNDLDLFSELRTAALIGKIAAGSSAALNAQTALAMATRNGAKALGLKHAGTLEINNVADIIAIEMDLNCQPLYHIWSQLVYATNSRQVSDVFVAGQHLVANGELTHIDRQALLAKVSVWQQKISKFNK